MTAAPETRLLSRREIAAWIAAYACIAAILVAIRFTSDDPDSALYAALSDRLAAGPVSHWIAPQWWGQWNSEGWFREHPIGVFLLPTIMGAIGIPASQAAYIAGVGFGLASLLLLCVLVSRVTSRVEARYALVLLQLMPVAFIFRIRANHEYPMLLCLLAVLVGIDGVRQSWRWVPVIAAALAFALLVKGVFIVMILLAATLWLLLNPTRAAGSTVRPVVAMAIGIAATVAVALVYDALYLRVTGETFWRPYWERQLGPLDIATPIAGGTTLLGHLLFYVIRLLWHPAPWSLALVLAACSGGLVARVRALPVTRRHGLLFAVGFALAAIALLSPSSRFAERYAFSATYAVAAAGAVVALGIWPRLRALVERLDARVPLLPVVVWTLLMVLRLVIGPTLPRI